MIRYLSVILLFLFPFLCEAQKRKHEQKDKQPASASQTELAQYEQRIPQIISFLEYSFNTLGDDSVPSREKEVIVNSSYLKVFRDDKVQIEDDLVEDRKAITYKSAQAYLRDIDYFFKDVKFHYTIESIKSDQSGKNVFFIVKARREIFGTSIEGENIRNVKERTIEINLDEKKEELKIASIYTKNLNQEEELKTWWKNLSSNWKDVLSHEVSSDESTDEDFLNSIISIEKLDLSNHKEIKDFNVLSKLERLRILNLSHTNLSNVDVLRNCGKLETLNIGFTKVSNMEALKYEENLKELNIENTGVSNAEPLRNYSHLQKLDISGTRINNLSFISSLQELKDLDASELNLTSLAGIEYAPTLEKININKNLLGSINELSGLQNLEMLDFSETSVSSIEPLVALPKLRVVNCSKTSVNTILSLKNLKAIERIYCENTSVSREEASRLMNSKQGLLVIFESENLMNWWTSLSGPWRNLLGRSVSIDENPSREQIAAVVNIKVINASDIKHLASLEPLRLLRNLKELNISNTDIEDLKPLEELNNLILVEAPNTRIKTLEPLRKLPNLKRVNIEATKVPIGEIKQFIQEKPACLLLYRTNELNLWWQTLSPEWKKVFSDNLKISKTPGPDQLHYLTNKDSIEIDNPDIKDLNALSKFQLLKALRITNTQIEDISALKEIYTLQSLYLIKSPVRDISILKDFVYLKVLDLSNTPIKDLEPLANSRNLEVLKFPGTPVKKLKYIKALENIRILDISNTNVGSLNPIQDFQKIKYLTCFNTDLSKKNVDKFKKNHPDCTVVFY